MAPPQVPTVAVALEPENDPSGPCQLPQETIVKRSGCSSQVRCQLSHLPDAEAYKATYQLGSSSLERISTYSLPSTCESMPAMTTRPPLEKFEVFDSTHTNPILHLLRTLVAVSLTANVSLISCANVIGTSTFLIQRSIVLGFSVTGPVEVARSYINCVYFNARLCAVPPSERTRVPYARAVFTFVLMWELQPIGQVIPLAQAAQCERVHSTTLFVEEVVGNLLFYRDTSIMTVVLARLSWWQLLGSPALVFVAHAAVLLTFAFYTRDVPARTPLVTRITVVRIDVYLSYVPDGVSIFTAVLTAMGLAIIAFTVCEMRWAWRFLNRLHNLYYRRQQRGHRILLSATPVVVVCMFMTSVLAAAALTIHSVTLQLLIIAAEGAPALSFMYRPALSHWTGNTFCVPLYTFWYTLVQNTMVLATLAIHAVLFLPPETPTCMRHVECGLPTHKQGFIATHVCCKREPIPFPLTSPYLRSVDVSATSAPSSRRPHPRYLQHRPCRPLRTSGNPVAPTHIQHNAACAPDTPASRGR
ncbi:hypothetical protein CDCA_CDCA03G1037 [Cyanidium caldarium]|uniref:Uncharacterized protein n=1 Tax=Cyanidium caldarium TaxID=2771 RepID=A0AAV9IRY7_CYACA|nr:hypothetical protein CDCA_CDCA03G1037 [Cyanidium caldarium]